MTTHERILYQFPISHYCEKTRWNLDAKGLSYTIRDVVPGTHVLTLKRITSTRTVPLLVDQGTPVSDSTAIALHLEAAHPDPPLLPKGGPERARALELEDFFDQKVGTAVRQWIYGQLMLAKPGTAAKILLGAYPLPVRVLGKIAAPALEYALRSAYRINAEGIKKAYSRILAGADRLDQELGGDPSRYLVGDSLSLADITAASLLAPIIAPPTSPYGGVPAPTPLPILELRAHLRERTAGKWVLERYERDRGKQARGAAYIHA